MVIDLKLKVQFQKVNFELRKATEANRRYILKSLNDWPCVVVLEDFLFRHGLFASSRNMGGLIKVELARLVTLTAAGCK